MALGSSVRSVAIKLDAKVTDYVAQMRVAQQATRDFMTDAAESAAENESAWQKVGAQMTVVGAAITAGLGVAVAKFAEFDQSMSAAEAATQATGAELQALRQAALDMGAATMFSATESADAITAMGKAGVATKDILGGGLKGALDLAAAGQLQVADAAEIAATAMTQFGLSGRDLPHVADLLAAGAGKAQGEVTDLANAMKFVGPVAKGMGVSIEETTGSLALFASQGIIGEQAGTSLRGVLLSLTSPGKQAAGVMADLGINLYDTNGNFVGVAGAAQQLHDALGPLDEATRNQALGQIFGNQQITAARILYEGGAKAVDDWTAQVDDAGFAARQAAQLTDNLRGDVERLGGAMDTALIQSGSTANSTLRAMVQEVTHLIDIYNALPGPVQTGATALVGVTGAVTLLGGGLIALAPRIQATRQALTEMGRTGAVIQRGLSGTRNVLVGPWGAAILAATIGLGVWASKHEAATRRVQELTAAIQADSGAIGENSRVKVANALESDGLLEDATRLGISLDTLTDAYLGNSAAIAQVRAETDKYGGAFRQSFGPDWFDSIRGLDDQTAAAVRLRKGLADGNSETNKAAAAAKRIAAASNEATDGLDGQAQSTADLAAAQEDAVPLTQSMIDALRLMGPAAQASDQDVKDLAKSLEDFQTRVSDAFESATDVIGNFQVDTSEKAGSVTHQLEKSYRDTLKLAKQFSDDIDTVTREGLDPTVIASLLEAGPERAAPILQAMVKDHSGRLIDMANESAESMATIEARVLEQARLTNLAMHSSTDTMVNDLSTAMQLAEAKARLGGKATADALAEELNIGAGEVERISSEFGISLATNVKKGAGSAFKDVQTLNSAVENLPDSHDIAFRTSGTSSVLAQAREIKAAILAIPGYKSITVAAKISAQNSALLDLGVRRASGGLIPFGLGGPREDNVLIAASSGEFVVNAASTAKHYDLIQAINADKFANGGIVGYASGGKVTDPLIGLRSQFGRWLDTDAVGALIGMPDAVLAESVQRINTAFDKVEKITDKLAKSHKRSARELAADAAAAEKELSRIAVARDKVVDKLSDASDRLDTITKQYDDMVSRVASQAGAAGALSRLFFGRDENGDDVVRTWQDALAGMQQVVTDTRSFTQQVEQLRAAGLDESLIQQIIGDQNGAQMAAAILAGGQEAVTQFNDTAAALTKASEALGKQAADGVYGGAKAAAEAAVAQLKKDQARLEGQMRAIGAALRDALEAGIAGKSVKGVSAAVEAAIRAAMKTPASVSQVQASRVPAPVTQFVSLAGQRVELQVRMSNPLTGEEIRREMEAVVDEHGRAVLDLEPVG